MCNALSGNERGRATKENKKLQYAKSNSSDLDMLEWVAAAGEIDLKYLDESGFCAWSEPSYTYYKRGEQKRLEQTKRRRRRLSIVGLFQHESSFVYGLVIGGVARKAYIKMMESEAESASHIMSGRLTRIKLLPPATNRNESNH